MNLSPLRYKGQLLVAASLIDLRDRLAAAEELSQSERRLRTLNKELESIVYVASHDMRSPLVNLQGFSRQLTAAIQKLEASVGELPEAKRTELEPIMREEIPEAIGFIASSTRKMDTLIKGLLHMSRLGRVQLHFTAIDMNRLMEEAVRATQFVLNERGIDVKVSDLPPCRGDEGQIGQVFSNLLDNAIKYLDPSRHGEIRIHGHREDGYSVYVVEDNGVGIAEDHQAQVFEIFHRLNPGGSVAGEGLGLSVVRRIVDRHDGDVRVESEPGKGSRFIVTLPATSKVVASKEVQRA